MQQKKNLTELKVEQERLIKDLELLKVKLVKVEEIEKKELNNFVFSKEVEKKLNDIQNFLYFLINDELDIDNFDGFDSLMKKNYSILKSEWNNSTKIQKEYNDFCELVKKIDTFFNKEQLKDFLWSDECNFLEKTNNINFVFKDNTDIKTILENKEYFRDIFYLELKKEKNMFYWLKERIVSQIERTNNWLKNNELEQILFPLVEKSENFVKNVKKLFSDFYDRYWKILNCNSCSSLTRCTECWNKKHSRKAKRYLNKLLWNSKKSKKEFNLINNLFDLKQSICGSYSRNTSNETLKLIIENTEKTKKEKEREILITKIEEIYDVWGYNENLRSWISIGVKEKDSLEKQIEIYKDYCRWISNKNIDF